MVPSTPSSDSASPSAGGRRLRRWLLGLGIGALLLVGYALALQAIGTRIGDGVESSLRSAPVVDDRQHRAAD
ncbi:hypothetical protein [Luteimonas huabeiensis]|uniref:hypothetical protein n=1 Tax=Luteimonas huabeiensis TaxID=1244513 RepID=UPI000466D72D|nr:hypothetical protein [Luteimonas huabeiensis]